MNWGPEKSRVGSYKGALMHKHAFSAQIGLNNNHNLYLTTESPKNMRLRRRLGDILIIMKGPSIKTNIRKINVMLTVFYSNI